MRRVRALARRVGAKAVTTEDAVLDASVLWLCVPDREIRGAAVALAKRAGLATPRQAAGIVDQPHHLQRRGLVWPDRESHFIPVACC